MIFKQLSYLPIIFQVDENIIYGTSEFLKRNNLNFNRVIVVSGKSHSRHYAQQLIGSKPWEQYCIDDNTFEEVEKLKNHIEHNRYDLVIAIGGGKVLDTVKRVGYLININHLSIPTIISNDGLISPISVIKNQHGKTESIPGMMPMGVVIDLDIIQQSPINYIRAASGDILSNLSATNDWVLAYQKNMDNINDIGFHLSRSAANALLYFNQIELKFKPFLRMVIQGQINSGIAMSLAGTSRPCSGSEHLISHAISFLGLMEDVLHGIQVASISLFTLFLQGKLQDIHLHYAIATGIPLNFTTMLAHPDVALLRKIYHLSKQMRPGRYTVLDELNEETFLKQVVAYEHYINEISRITVR
ncbi:iron-containing alcohol dehydrogenase [Pedobacter sp.]|uniref:iron-containing alcohol dehydrogenase n=1 Tax=Pedobacter sp. TaxID=1411316 RepID=UPI003D7FC01B